jgi:histone deacetylase complex regulatory component SIN3
VRGSHARRRAGPRGFDRASAQPQGDRLKATHPTFYTAMSVQGACQDPQPLMLSQTTTTLEMRNRAAQPLNLTDALNYLDLVKLRFRETRRPELYDRFLEIILDFSKGL